MDEIPSLSSGGVGSRFVSQTDVDAAKQRREEQWKAAYARLGQEPPERPQEDVYDGRSLAEKLASNRAAQQEEWEEKMKLSNQFRSLEEDEVVFLDSVRKEELEKERKRKERDSEEVRGFLQAVAERQNQTSKPLVETKPKQTVPSSSHVPSTAKVGSRKDKDRLKGVIVRKKTDGVKSKSAELSANVPRSTAYQSEDEPQKGSKRRKTDAVE